MLHRSKTALLNASSALPTRFRLSVRLDVMTLDSHGHPINFALNSSLIRSSCVRWFSKISCITVLGSPKTGTDPATGFRRRRRRFLILAIGSRAGTGAAAGCRVRRFRFGMPGRLTSSQEYSEPVMFQEAGFFLGSNRLVVRRTRALMSLCSPSRLLLRHHLSGRL